MCYQEDVSLPRCASSGAFVAWMLIVVIAVLALAGCGPTVRECKIEIWNESGTVNIGNKDVSIPVRATIPLGQ